MKLVINENGDGNFSGSINGKEFDFTIYEFNMLSSYYKQAGIDYTKRNQHKIIDDIDHDEEYEQKALLRSRLIELSKL